MTISNVKSEVMVFNCRAPEQLANVSVQGQQLPVSRVFTVPWGMVPFSEGGCAQCTQGCCQGKFAIACMHRKLSDLDVGNNVNLALKLYNALVMPAMLYGCEVWGTSMLRCRAPANSTALPEKVHRTVHPVYLENAQQDQRLGRVS